MMTANRFFSIKKGKDLLLSRGDAFDTTEKLSEIGVSISASTLYKMKKGEGNLKRVSSNGDSIIIECRS